MHELSLAMSVDSIVRRQMAAYPGARLTAIEIEIGSQSGVDVPSFRTAIESVILTSPWPNAEAVLTIIPARFQCLDCDTEFTTRESAPDEYYPACPHCGSRQSLPVSGREFRLTAIRLDK